MLQLIPPKWAPFYLPDSDPALPSPVEGVSPSETEEEAQKRRDNQASLNMLIVVPLVLILLASCCMLYVFAPALINSVR